MRSNSIDPWLGGVIFLAGVGVCYITVQFQLFEIELKLNIPELIVSIGTAASAIYIAQTIQKNLNKNQNKYAYLETKLDALWSSFNIFSQTLELSDHIQLQNVSSFAQNSYLSINFLRSVFIAYDISTVDIDEIERKTEKLQDFLETLPIQSNIIDIRSGKSTIHTATIEIETSFSTLLRIIHDI